ncbi:MAG: DNA repair protein RecO [Solobacterium sp.]|nr:DNA repair protein RecO [Solobacterium sp.]
MNDQVVGLILKEADYRENSVILTVLTKEFGKLSIVVRGVRKLTSKNRAATIPYTRSELSIDYREGRTIFHLKSAVCLEFYRFLHEDLSAGCAIAVLAELIDAFTLDESDIRFAEICFDLFEETCRLLNERHPADLVLAVAVAELMKTQGIGPDVDECVHCGKKSVRAISAKEGGFLCQECAVKLGVPFRETAELRQFRLINKASLRHMNLLEERIEDAREDLSVLIEMIRSHAGLRVRSYRLLAALDPAGEVQKE